VLVRDAFTGVVVGRVDLPADARFATATPSEDGQTLVTSAHDGRPAVLHRPSDAPLLSLDP